MGNLESLELLTDGSLDSFEKGLGEFVQRDDVSSVAKFNFEFHIHNGSSRPLKGIQEVARTWNLRRSS